MNRMCAGLCIGVVMAGVVAVMGAEPPQLLRVKGDRVNLRCRPVRDSEVVCQVGHGEQLSSLIVQEEWYGVTPPANAPVWIHKDFVQNNAVVSKLNVRGGPGINFSSVGALNKGDKITIVKTLGDWLQIVPPPGAVLWIHRDLVELATAVAPVVAEPVAIVPTVAPSVMGKPVATNAVVAAKTLPPVETLTNVSLTVVMPVQTKVSQPPAGKVWEGIVQPLDFLFNSAGNYRLVRQDSQGKTVVVCYLKGNASQLASMVGRKVQITGWDYWLNQSDLPTVVPETIAPVP